MLRRNKEKEVDYSSLNQILYTGKKLMNIGYFMAIVCLILLGTYLIKEWHILNYIGELLVLISPLFIGFIISWFFDPIVSKLEDKNIPRAIGCILVYILLIGSLFFILYLFIPTLASQVRDFVTSLPEIFENITNFTINLVHKFDTNNAIDTVDLKKTISEKITEVGVNLGADVPGYIFTFGKALINGGLNVVLGLMVGFYLLFDFKKIQDAIYKWIPKKWSKDYKVLTKRLNTSLRNYIQGVLIVMLLVFITQTIGLTIAGMEAPVLFALFCAVTDIIPYFGPYIGAIPAIIVGFTISPITGICVVISILVVQLLENNFYQPLIMGHTMKLHPVTIMIGLLIFEHFFGILGMIIATPCIACLKVILSFVIERTELNKYFRIKLEDEINKKTVKKENVLVE